MQDIHAIGGGAGGLFMAAAGDGGGGDGGGDRRLRQHGNHNHHPLKCPRCDSLNTKFCYYNNYNLSQPRHFCKNCRRYWTKGGVLRNVPVGGGCRKSKRSKPKPAASTSTAAIVVVAASAADEAGQGEPKSNSHSSSESSSLTATTTTATATATETAKSAAGATGEVVSATDTNLLNFGESSGFFMSQNPTNPTAFDNQGMIDQHTLDSQIFSDISCFTDMIASSNDPGMLGFNEVDLSAYRLQQDDDSGKIVGPIHNEEIKIEDMNAAGYLDRTVQIGLTALERSRGNNDGLAALDWENTQGVNNISGSGEEGMFDFTEAVDHAYWSQMQ